jgi:hypothetical protein
MKAAMLQSHGSTRKDIHFHAVLHADSNTQNQSGFFIISKRE